MVLGAAGMPTTNMWCGCEGDNYVVADIGVGSDEVKYNDIECLYVAT